MISKKQKISIGTGVIVLGLLISGYVYMHNAPEPKPSSQVQVTDVSYSSDGVSFVYPSTYAVTEHSLDINGMNGKYVTLVPKNSAVPADSEGPPSITIEIMDNLKKTPLSDWLASITNGTPTPSKGFDYSETKIGGESAIAYTATGLYESDNVAIQHGTKVYIFSASWVSREDRTLTDLQKILSSVVFK